MTKKILTVLNLFTFITVFGQSGIGTHIPEGALDISSLHKDWGLVLPHVDQAENTKNPTGKAVKKGTIVYDLKENCIRYFNGLEWSGCLLAPVPNPIKLECSAAILNQKITVNYPITAGTTVSIPYSNTGEILAYEGLTIQSKGVTGLQAVLAAGSINKGSGNLIFSISGTPSLEGTAKFSLSIAGINCEFVVTVDPIKIKLECGSAILNGNAIANYPIATRTTVSIPYSNAGEILAHGGFTIQSKGVAGLQAVLSSGSFNKGSGNLVFSISGTPSAEGEARFSLSIAGITCEFVITVKNYTDIEVPIANLVCDVKDQLNYTTLRGKHIINGKEVTVDFSEVNIGPTDFNNSPQCGIITINSAFHLGVGGRPSTLTITFSRPVTNVGLSFGGANSREEFVFTTDGNQPIQLKTTSSCPEFIQITNNKINITGQAPGGVGGYITVGGKWFTELTIKHNGQALGAGFGFCLNSSDAL